MYILYIIYIYTYTYIYMYIYKNLKPTPGGQWRDLEQSYIHKPAMGEDKVSVPGLHAVTVQAWCKQCCLVCLTRPVWDSHSVQVVVWSDTPRGQARRWWNPEALTNCRTRPPCPRFPAGGVRWGLGTPPAAADEQRHQWALSQGLWLERLATAWW